MRTNDENADHVRTIKSVTVRVDDWVLFRTDGSYDRIGVEMKQAAKVTAATVKFHGSGYPRQCHILGVVAAYSDKGDAERARNSIAGVAGEHQRRERVARDIFEKAKSDATKAALQQIARLTTAAETE